MSYFIPRITAVGVNEISSRNKSFKIIPNPATDKASIVFDELIIPESATTISLLDISGRIVYQTKQNIKNNQFDLELHSLAQGTYCITIQTTNKVYSGRVVIIR